MRRTELNEILKQHKERLKDTSKGKRADLRGADLRGADLRGANLQYADLRGADLRGANLQRTNLRYANLQYANLRYANLQYANLRGADLRGANLQYADLRYANLRDANLRGADLRDADLRGANIDFSCLPLWCGGLDFKIDERQAKQLMYHVINLMQYSDIEIPKSNKSLFKWLSDSHLVTEHNLPILKEGKEE